MLTRPAVVEPFARIRKACTMHDSRSARHLSSPAADSDRKTRLDRRQWLATSGRGFAGVGAASMLSVLGCRSEDPMSPADRPSARTDVPLRVLWVGDADEAAVIRRTWQSISDQPVAMTVVAPPEAISANETDDTAGDDFWQAVDQNDVLVYPLIDVGQLVSSDGWMPVVRRSQSSGAAERTADRDAADVLVSGDNLPAALEIAASYGGESRGVLLGGFLPALLLGEQLHGKQSRGKQSRGEPLRGGRSTDRQLAMAGKPAGVATWEDFHRLAQQHPQRVVEPLAPMWAGCAYLWRAASSMTSTWLFDRDDLQPLVDQPEYVAVLEQMQQTAQYQPETRATPGQIYSRIASGEWLAGIGFPIGGNRSSTPGNDGGEKTGGDEIDGKETGDEDPPSSVAVQVTAVPAHSDDENASAARDVHRQMFDPFALVGSLSASCRQTTAATMFLDWLAGGEGSEPVYRSLSRLIDRHAKAEPGQDPAAAYRQWWNRRIGSPSIVPPLQLIRGRQYHRMLDQNVRDCLSGNCSAAEATERTADQWAELHRAVGIKQQQRAWRRALGFL